MANADYYKTTLESLLEDCGAEGLLSEQQIQHLAEGIATSVECEAMYTGAECVPHPATTELEELKRHHALEMRHQELIHDVFRKRLATALRLDPKGLYVENGEIKYTDLR